MDENYNWVGRWRRKSGGPCKTDLRLSAFLQGWYWLIFMPTCHFLAKVSLSRSQWGELRWEKTRPKISTPFYLIPAVLQSQPIRWPCHSPAKGSQIDWWDFGPVVFRQSWFVTVQNLGIISEVCFKLWAQIQSWWRTFTVEFEVVLKWNNCALVCSPHWEDFVTAVFFVFFNIKSLSCSGSLVQVKNDDCSRCTVIPLNSNRRTRVLEQNGCFPSVWEVSVGAIMYEQLCLLWNIDSSSFLSFGTIHCLLPLRLL